MYIKYENISNIELYIFLIKALYSIYRAHKAYCHRELWILSTFNDILRGGHNPKHYQVSGYYNAQNNTAIVGIPDVSSCC